MFLCIREYYKFYVNQFLSTKHLMYIYLSKILKRTTETRLYKVQGLKSCILCIIHNICYLDQCYKLEINILYCCIVLCDML